MTPAHEYAKKHAARFLTELKDIVRIPSVSTDMAFAGEVQRAAQWLADDMRRIGLDNVQVMPTGGHPVVFGEWLKAGPDKPTILVYGHYDVQPAVLEDGWHHDPFDPIEKDGRILGRGSSDDKGQVIAHLKAVESLLATGGAPVNLKYLIEGEEESGSVNLTNFIKTHKALLNADICLISDTGIKALDQPSMTYGLRGLVTMEVIVSGPKADLHSGTGGILHNPTQALAEIVAQLHKPDGTVAIPGFYDDVLPISDAERAELSKGDITQEEWDAHIGAPQTWGESGFSLIERQTARPTLEINGISGGYAGSGFKTVIGAKAIAKISCRLVPNQSSGKIFPLVRDFILSITPPTVNIQINPLGMGEPALTDIQHPAIQAAVRAYSRSWDKPPILTRSGGSIPVVADFQHILGQPVVLLGFALPDAGAHGPNENFSTEMLAKAVDTIIHYMSEVAG